MGEPVLSFDGVTRGFADGSVALDGLDLAVGPGEMVSVVGPSGCGKTTMLRLASGLDGVTAGLVRSRADRPAFVFQEAALLPWRSTLGNVELFGELDGVGRGARRSRAEAALESVGLADAGHLLPSQLSVGMRMRASLARSLTVDPDLFLFDEPFAAVDEITRVQLQDLCIGLHSESGFAAVFVTHSIAEAVYLGDRVVVLSERPGRVLAEVEVPWPRPRPAELRYTAEFAELCGEVHRQLGSGTRR